MMNNQGGASREKEFGDYYIAFNMIQGIGGRRMALKNNWLVRQSGMLHTES